MNISKTSRRKRRRRSKMNKYEELKTKQQERVNSFPMKFAFNDKQFEEGMKELGLSPDDTDKVLSIGGGGFIRKSDKEAFQELFKTINNEIQEQIDKDKTGEHFIKDMFLFELENHEFGYTRELDDTLEALDLKKEDILNSKKLKKGLLLAIQEVKEVEW